MDGGIWYEGPLALSSAFRMRRCRNRASVCVPRSRILGLNFPLKRVTVNLAPADLRKEGPAYDLPIAIGILAASQQITADLTGALVIGELSLDGAVRHTNGVLSMAMLAHERGLKTIFVPASDAPEAALIADLQVIPIESLFALYAHLQGMQPIPPYRQNVQFDSEGVGAYSTDFCEIRGQEHVKRALEVGGAGYTTSLWLDRRVQARHSRVGAALDHAAARCARSLGYSHIYSVSDLLPADSPLVRHRPFRGRIIRFHMRVWWGVGGAASGGDTARASRRLVS